MNYYLVTAKCGHVGKRRYVDIDFPVCAENGSEAAQIILKRSKVKKHLKNAITNVSKITKDEYEALIREDKYKGYLSSHFSRERYSLDLEIKKLESNHHNSKKEFKTRDERIAYIFKKYEMFNSNHIRSKEMNRINYNKEERI